MKTERLFQVIGTVVTNEHFGWSKDVDYGIYKSREEAEKRIEELDQEGVYTIYEAINKYKSEVSKFKLGPREDN